MQHYRHLLRFRPARFLLAGAVNTGVNFGVLNMLIYGLHQNKITSILVSTLCAIAVSFLLNRSFVFQDTERAGQRLPRFVLVAAMGVFVIQNSVYMACLFLLHPYATYLSALLSGSRLGPAVIEVNLSNLFASITVMFWNYNGYKLFVFDRKFRRHDAVEASAETD